MKGNTAEKIDTEDNVSRIKQTIKKENYPEFTLDRYGKNKPLNTYGNLKYMLERLGIKVRWNVMSQIREVIMPESESKLFLDDIENSALREIINKAELNYMPTTKIDDHLTTLAQQNSYHPITESIKSKPWDNQERLEKFISTVITTNNDLSHKLIRRWMISAMAAAFSENGFASQGVLVLQGKQNIGKTRWVKSLDPINCGAVKEGALLDPSNKDSVITCAAHWIVELGELDATFRRADMARLKSHITNQIDIVRFPYARKNSRLPRRTAFVATVNESQYLIDDTGNRRWWTIEVLKIDLNHGMDMQQVWAEVYYYWKNGEQHWLTIEELNLLNKTNTEHEQLDPFEEKVMLLFNWKDANWRKCNTNSMTASQVLELIGYSKPSRTDSTRMGKVLMKLTGRKPVRIHGGRHHTLPRNRCQDVT